MTVLSQFFAVSKPFLRYLRPVRTQVLVALVLVLIAPLAGALLLWLFKRLVDEVFIEHQLGLLPWFATGYLVIAGAKFAIDYADERLDAGIAERISQDVRTALFRHLITVSPGTLGRHSAGGLLAYLSGDVERISTLIYGAPLGVIANIARALCFGGFLLILSWKLTLLALLVVPPLALFVLWIAPRIRRVGRRARRKVTSWMSLAEETLSATALIHAFHTYSREAHRFTRRCDTARRAELQAVALQANLALVIELITLVGGLLVIGAAAYEVRAGHLSVGGVIAFLGAIGSLYDPIRSLSQSTSRFQRAAVSAERLLSLFDRRSLVEDRAGARTLSKVQGALEFRDVRFTYPDGAEVLHGVSFAVHPGESVAIVGPSGSGKSSLVRLLLRFHDPDSGGIFLDGMDIREFTQESLRHAIGVTFQESYVLSGSIAENIGYGDPDASKERVLAAAKAACVDEYAIRLPLGYQSRVGTRGERLSGGQRQRLALARALLCEAPLLVLDEATAAIDGETEELIQDAIGKFAGQRTILVISHRLSTIRSVDRVLVLEKGAIVESGAPSALLRNGTRCHELFAEQIREIDSEATQIERCHVIGSK